MSGDKLPQAGGGFELHLQDLASIGFPVQIYMPVEGPLTTFVLEQYACPRMSIGVRAGDVVIDAGACWGDTAFYFAHKAGEKGRVHAFEFVPENLNVLRRNLALNPHIASRINILEAPVWSTSGVSLTASCSGPGAAAKPGGASGGVRSLSIDDMVVRENLDRVDFIKMDIEGAEYEALKGATSTLQIHRPDLALCVYHSRDDFTRLARYVDGLGLGYRFALGHFTIHAEETVLYATARHSKS